MGCSSTTAPRRMTRAPAPKPGRQRVHEGSLQAGFKQLPIEHTRVRWVSGPVGTTDECLDRCGHLHLKISQSDAEGAQICYGAEEICHQLTGSRELANAGHTL